MALAVVEEACCRIDGVLCAAAGPHLTAASSGVVVIIGPIDPCDLRRLWGVQEVIVIEVQRRLRRRSVKASEG